MKYHSAVFQWKDKDGTSHIEWHVLAPGHFVDGPNVKTETKTGLRSMAIAADAWEAHQLAHAMNQTYDPQPITEPPQPGQGSVGRE